MLQTVPTVCAHFLALLSCKTCHTLSVNSGNFRTYAAWHTFQTAFRTLPTTADMCCLTHFQTIRSGLIHKHHAPSVHKNCKNYEKQLSKTALHTKTVATISNCMLHACNPFHTVGCLHFLLNSLGGVHVYDTCGFFLYTPLHGVYGHASNIPTSYKLSAGLRLFEPYGLSAPKRARPISKTSHEVCCPKNFQKPAFSLWSLTGPQRELPPSALQSKRSEAHELPRVLLLGVEEAGRLLQDHTSAMPPSRLSTLGQDQPPWH